MKALSCISVLGCIFNFTFALITLNKKENKFLLICCITLR